jgi:hypothetical protein
MPPIPYHDADYNRDWKEGYESGKESPKGYIAATRHIPGGTFEERWKEIAALTEEMTEYERDEVAFRLSELSRMSKGTRDGYMAGAAAGAKSP